MKCSKNIRETEGGAEKNYSGFDASREKGDW